MVQKKDITRRDVQDCVKKKIFTWVKKKGYRPSSKTKKKRAGKGGIFGQPVKFPIGQTTFENGLPKTYAYNLLRRKKFLKVQLFISKTVKIRTMVDMTKNVPLVEYYQMTSCCFFEIFEKILSFFPPHKLNMGFEVSEYLGNGKRQDHGSFGQNVFLEEYYPMMEKKIFRKFLKI